MLTILVALFKEMGSSGDSLESIIEANRLDKVSDFAAIIEPLESQLEASIDEYPTNKLARSVGVEKEDIETATELVNLEEKNRVERNAGPNKKKKRRRKKRRRTKGMWKNARRDKQSKAKQNHVNRYYNQDDRKKRRKAYRSKRLNNRGYYKQMDNLAKYDDFLKMRNYAATFIIIPPTLKPAKKVPDIFAQPEQQYESYSGKNNFIVTFEYFFCK